MGSSEPGRGWTLERFGTNALYVDVDTSSGHFVDTPIYIAALGGFDGMSEVQGVACLYNPTATSFRVYVTSATGQYLTVEDAASGRWRVNWIGFRNIGEKKAPHLAFGASSLWSQKTIQDSTYLKNDIFTTDAHFKSMPTYLTALTGDRNMHTLWGTSAIYASSLDHFAIYLRPKPGGGSLSLRNAQQWHYGVNWVGLGQVHLKHLRFGFIGTWKEDPDSDRQGIEVDIKFYKPFKETPKIITAIQGNEDGHHYATVGSTSVQEASAHGCKIKVKFVANYRFKSVSPAQAKEWGWTIEFLAAGVDVDDE